LRTGKLTKTLHPTALHVNEYYEFLRSGKTKCKVYEKKHHMIGNEAK